MKNILLVEPNYPSKYPPLGLMKISAHHKAQNDEVCFVKGMAEKLPFSTYNIVYISTLFTFDASEAIKTINYYSEHCNNADIIVGGVMASLIPEIIHSETGITPHVGLLKEVDNMPPDYSIADKYVMNDCSFVFTSRGCPNHCEFCAVKKLEPEFAINPNWKKHIDPQRSRIMIHDNNITAAPMDHYQAVMFHLMRLGKEVIFDNGFDCRLFTQDHCEALAKTNVGSVRFAFDTMAQDGHAQRAVELCLKNGISASKIMVYVLYNYKDDLEEASYRAREIARLGARPYAMEYMPLTATSMRGYYHGAWTKDLCIDFARYINHARMVSVMDFEEWRDMRVSRRKYPKRKR